MAKKYGNNPFASNILTYIQKRGNGLHRLQRPSSKRCGNCKRDKLDRRNRENLKRLRRTIENTTRFKSDVIEKIFDISKNIFSEKNNF